MKAGKVDAPVRVEFETTHWSMVLQAGREGSVPALQALENLCRSYWRPLFVFARRLGQDEPAAEDSTQGFFAYFLKHGGFRAANPERGRFRTFLLASFQRFMASEWAKQHAAKRGGQTGLVPLEALPDGEFDRILAANGDPRHHFDRAWAVQLFSAALHRLRLEYERAGKSAEYAALARFLSETGGLDEYAPVAQALRLKPATIAVQVHRLRRRYGELVRLEVARTVPGPDDVEAEVRYLMGLVSQ